MGSYAVRLLGPPEVRLDGRLLAFKSRKALLLLAYLTLEARPGARETLAALLWPDSDPDVARSALRTTLSQLRTLLGDRLSVTKHTIALTWTPADDLDLRRLSAGDPEAWNGELLEGLPFASEPFEHWLAGQREALRAQADRAFDARSATLLDTEAGRAAETATRWLALDRLNEAAWRRLILARVTAGQLRVAREAFETCRMVIHTELSLDLAPETLALQTRVHPDAPPTSTPVDLPAFLVGGPLVGRQAEFARLAEVYRLAASGLPRVVLLCGEPGIGKTRLAGELLAWARERGAPLLRGRALEGADAPFAPLVEALRREAAALRTRLNPALRADLARLLPEVYDGPPSEPAGDPRAQVLTALSAAFLALTPPSSTLDPLVLLIDDLQWTDASSQDTLLYLAAQLAETPRPTLLLLTARSEYLATGSPLSGWLARVRRHLPLHEEALVPLGADDTEHLMAHSVPRLSAALQAQLTAWLYAQTAGHPLYLTETVKSLLESGALREGALDEARLPQGAQGVRAAIGERLARLTSASLALAQGAAVLGQGAAFETLRGVADLDEVTALGGYEELLQTGLLLEQGDLAQLSHDRVRETVRDALSSPRRRLLHGRAFRVLEGLGAAPAVLARHALDGGLRAEAATWFERAAEAADEVGAQAERIASLEQALSLIPTERQFHAERFELFEKICLALVDSAKGDMNVGFLYTESHLSQLPEQLIEERVLCLALHAYRLSNAGMGDDAAAVIDSTYNQITYMENPYIRNYVLESDAFIGINLWDWSRSERALDQSKLLAKASDNDIDYIFSDGYLLSVRAKYLGYRDPFRQLVDNLLTALDCPAWLDLKAFKRDDFATVQMREICLGALCLDEVETAKNLSDSVKEKIVQFDHKIYLSGYTGMMLTNAGLYDQALSYLRPILAHRATFGRTIAMFTSSVANCLAHVGIVDEARAILNELSALYARQTNRTYFGNTVQMMAEAYLALSEFPSALFHYCNALQAYEPSVVLNALRGIGQILSAEGAEHMAAYCVGAVLAGKVTWLRDRQQAEAILADLRARGPAVEVETALAEGASTSLKDVARRVRTELAGRHPVPVAAI